MKSTAALRFEAFITPAVENIGNKTERLPLAGYKV